jgi:hypothetical protein
LAVNDNNTKPEAVREGLQLDKRLIRYAISDPGVPTDDSPGPVFVYASPLELASLAELREIVDGALDEMFSRLTGETFDVPPVAIQEVLADDPEVVEFLKEFGLSEVPRV